MKIYNKWLQLYLGLGAFGLLLIVLMAWKDYVLEAWIAILYLAASLGIFLSLWRAVKNRGIQSDVEISRVLGKDAKDALNFGDVGIITYNDEYVVTWASPYFKEHRIELVNRKLTSWMENIRDLFDEDVDTIQGESKGQVYLISRKEGAQVLFVKNITELTKLRHKLVTESVVVGLMNLDNYDEYQSFENEEILNKINTHLRTPLFDWARDNGIFLRRLRSDRFLLILDTAILSHLRQQNFAILQKIKDEADKLDISVTLSLVFASGTNDFTNLDHTLNELLELVQSRGGDQVAIRNGNEPIEFIGGNSERASTPSKVRVRIVGGSIQDLMMESPQVFIAGHVNTDFDAMGAALAASSWARSMGKKPYIVLKDVPRDRQLQDVMDHYQKVLKERHTLITEEEALRLMNPAKDLLVMVDHSNPDISSASRLLEDASRIVIIDHHRRSEHIPKNPMLSYIESTASSSCELMTELLQNSAISVPIYEAEATIMYLGILVDTNRFKSHTSERTFQAAGTLKNWGANSTTAEKALQEDYNSYRLRNALIEQTIPYKDRFFIAPLKQAVSRTMLSQVSDSLLRFKGCQAAFTIGVNENNGNVAVSARSDGSYNVQFIMEKMNGGGHFAAAALERENTTVEAVLEELKSVLDKEEEQ